MIISRYIQRNIYIATFVALFALVFLSLFFIFVSELKHLGDGAYDLFEAFKFLALNIPARMAEFIPLAALIGSMLSLGALAGNSEIIAMQASGVSQRRMLFAVLQAALMLALVSYLLGDWVAPDSSARAYADRSQARQETSALSSDAGIWIRDESSVIHIGSLLPNGYARDVEIYGLDAGGRLYFTLTAATAAPRDNGWELLDVRRSFVDPVQSRSEHLDRLAYEGSLSPALLQVLVVEPYQMSIGGLRAYLAFLDENGLDAGMERLIFWKKVFAPLSVVVMCLLAFPFVLGVQRQSNTGQRLMLGILLGLSFIVVDQLLTQLGAQFRINPVLIALLPSALFLGLAVYLLVRRQSHGFAGGFLARA